MEVTLNWLTCGPRSDRRFYFACLFQQDYIQYYLDLDNANAKSEMELETLWEVEYVAREQYGIENLSTSSLSAMANHMRDICELNETQCQLSFQEFFTLNSVSYNKSPCGKECQKYGLCAVTEVEVAKYNDCLDNWGSGNKVQTELSHTLLMFAFLCYISAIAFW